MPGAFRVSPRPLCGQLLFELGPHDLDELTGPSGPYPEPDTQRVGEYRLLVNGTVSRVFSPSLSQQSHRRALNDCSFVPSMRDVLVELGCRLRRTVIPIRMDSRHQSIDLAYDCHATRGADRCKRPGPTSDQPINRSGPAASNAAFPN